MSENESKRNSRRKFLRAGTLAGGAAVVGLTVLPSIANLDKSGKLRQQLGFMDIPPVEASVQVSQKAVDGATITKYVDPVPTFVGARVNASSHQNLTINNLELQENILPANFYSHLKAPYKDGTYVWGYSVNNGVATAGPLYPAFTIETKRNKAINVTYVNSLTNTFLQKYITIDQSIHWANPHNFLTGLPSVLRKLLSERLRSSNATVITKLIPNTYFWL